jgi:hypothetical protein
VGLTLAVLLMLSLSLGFVTGYEAGHMVAERNFRARERSRSRRRRASYHLGGTVDR